MRRWSLRRAAPSCRGKAIRWKSEKFPKVTGHTNTPQSLCGSTEALIPHLFRTEFTRITAVLCKLFGINHIEVAEDIAGETFLSALETWPYKGVPHNPTAWFYAIAKNKARNHLRRNQIYTGKVLPQIKVAAAGVEEMEIDLSEKNITD